MPVLKLVRFPIKLLIPVILLAALLAGWGIDVMREPDALQFRKARGVFAVLIVAVAGTWLLWGTSWLFPSWVEHVARWMLRNTIAGMGIAPTGAFGTKPVQSAAHYFLNMLHWQVPGVAGMTLGAALWFVGLKKGDRRARMALPVALLVGTVQLILLNYTANPTVPSSFYAYRPPVLYYFEGSRMPYRYADVFGGPPLAAVSTQALELPLDFESIAAVRNPTAPALAEFQERLMLEHG